MVSVDHVFGMSFFRGKIQAHNLVALLMHVPTVNNIASLVIEIAVTVQILRSLLIKPHSIRYEVCLFLSM